MVKSSFEIAGPQSDDEYWDGDFHDESDDDDESDEEDGKPQANGHVASVASSPGLNRKKKMKKMKVGDQQNARQIQLVMEMLCRKPVRIGICFAVSVVVVLMVIVIPHHNNNKQMASLLEPEEQCQVHTTDEPFSEWMHHIRVANRSSLCSNQVGGSECNCHNPFNVSEAAQKPGWQAVFDMNLKQLNETSLDNRGSLDVVMYGDSIVERLNGRVFGTFQDTLQGQEKITTDILTKRGRGTVNGLALGIAGDEIYNLIYRLKHGEQPAELKPSFWWLMIGTNDLVKRNCGADAVVAGIITASEEILRSDERRHDDAAPVVINSLFPRVELYGDPLWETIQTINQRLECYADTTEGVVFFNATDMFLENGGQVVDKELFISDGIHLSVEGSKLWLRAIVNKIEHSQA